MNKLAAIIAIFFAAALCHAQINSSTTTDYLEVTAGRLYYEECGTGSAVVLLHDGLLHSVVWDDMWPALCSKYHVLRYDRRGYGRSPAAKTSFSPEDDLLHLLDHAKIAQAVLVGSSSGSALAIDFTVAHPDRVEALFLIGPVVHGMRSSDYFLQRGNIANAPLAKQDFRAAAENWSKDQFQVNGNRPEARKKILDTLTASPQNFSVPGQFEIRPSPPTVTRLAEVQAPTLLIVGEGDIADVHAFSGAIQAAFPVVRREVWKDCGHLVQLEKPAELTDRLATFISVVERKTISLPVAVLQRYNGVYSLPNSRIIVTTMKGRLVLQINGDADVPLFAESQTHFLVRTTGTEVQFEQDANGKVTAMILRNPGGEPVRCPRL
jgi:pimeloyl-ACP methyl ester carboxylesterase